jgi:hypothetical protein
MSLFKMSVENKNKLIDKFIPCLTIKHPKDKEYLVKHGTFFRTEISLFSDIDIRQILTIDNNFDFYSKFIELLNKKCKNVHFVNLKAGIKKEYFIGLGYFKKVESEYDVINYYPDEIRNRIQILFNKKMISKEDYTRFTNLVYNKPTLEQYLLLNESLKDIYRLNWSIDEIIENNKDNKYALDNNLLKNKCMANFIIEIKPKFYIDVSNAFGFKYQDKFNLINEEKNDSILISYYFNLVNKEYLKAIKRIYSTLKYEAKRNVLSDTENETVEKLKIFLNSDVNVLNLTKNYLKTLIVVYDNNIDIFKNFKKSVNSFLKEIKPVSEKDTYHNINDILNNIKNQEDIYTTINELNKSIDILSEKVLIKVLNTLNQSRFNYESLQNKINIIIK